MRFQVGDRVVRPIDCFKPLAQWEHKHGTITKAYSKEKQVFGISGLELGPYPEVYDVEWDEDFRKQSASDPSYFIGEQGLLPHGIDHEGHNTLADALVKLWDRLQPLLYPEQEEDYESTINALFDAVGILSSRLRQVFTERFDFDHTWMLRKAYDQLVEYINDVGGCDHSVGICMCTEKNIADDLALLFGEERLVGCVKCHEQYTTAYGHFCEIDQYEEEKKAEAYGKDAYEISLFKQEFESEYRLGLGYVV